MSLLTKLRTISDSWVTLGDVLELTPLPFMAVLLNQLKQDGSNYWRPWHTSSIYSTWKYKDVDSLVWQPDEELLTRQEPFDQGNKMVPITRHQTSESESACRMWDAFKWKPSSECCCCSASGSPSVKKRNLLQDKTLTRKTEPHT